MTRRVRAVAVDRTTGMCFGVPMRSRAEGDWEHGTSFGYQYAKCRCDACRGWKRDYARRLRKSPLALVDDPSVSIPTFNAALVELAKRHRPELKQIIASMQEAG